MKEYNHITQVVENDEQRESFYITSDSAVYQRLVNPNLDEKIKQKKEFDYQAIMKLKNLP